MARFCIAEWLTAYRKLQRTAQRPATALAVLLLAGAAAAQGGPASAGAGAPVATASPATSAAGQTRLTPYAPVALPRLTGRLHAADIGLVINTADPLSVRIGEYYASARGLAPEQVLRLDVPMRSALTREELDRLRAAIDQHFGRNIQALALAWTEPYAVECNSITGALALGVDSELCKNSCGVSRPSRYFNSASTRPYTDLGWRPSMLLAARNVAQGKALIDRGVAADGALVLRGRPPVTAMFLTTDDAARRVRTALYPPPGFLPGPRIDIRIAPAAELATAKRVLIAITGSERVKLDPAMDWAPGGLGDHLTSTGGDLFGNHGQSTVLAWLDAGATASHGTVSEPCNHLQKFPHPQVLLGHYMQGATAIEAYWKSVAWPQQSLFVGEPLAAPFASR
jgi:uncharacterized protein (TIGR03790 family)